MTDNEHARSSPDSEMGPAEPEMFHNDSPPSFSRGESPPEGDVAEGAVDPRDSLRWLDEAGSDEIGTKELAGQNSEFPRWTRLEDGRHDVAMTLAARHLADLSLRGASMDEAARDFSWGFGLPFQDAVQFMEEYNNRQETPVAYEAAWAILEKEWGHPDLVGQSRGWRVPSRPLPGPVQYDQIEDHRPFILISTAEYEINDRAISALQADSEIYCRGSSLVMIHRDCSSSKLLTRPLETPRIQAMTRPTIRERLAKNISWKKMKGSGKVYREIEAHPPDWCTAALEKRGNYPGLRSLEGIVETPVLLPDGTILDRPGYDERTGLLYEPSGEFPAIPKLVSREEAACAAELLFDLVFDFPFARLDIEIDGRSIDDGGREHRAAWLASLLTPLARHAIKGPCPLFLADANTPGAGKSKLCDLVSILCTGRDAARLSYTESEEEMRKQIFAIALAGDRMVLIDNIPTGAAFGGASIDGLLTGTVIKGRILGRSEMLEIPIHTVWYATGNNLGVKGDGLRRVVTYRLEALEERPEERTGFRIQGDLLEHVRSRRGELVVAGLTILLGFVQAGRPASGLTPMDFGAWSGLVRDAIYWATGADPCAARRNLIADDDERNTLSLLIEGWAELTFGTPGGMTARQAINFLSIKESSHLYPDFRELLGRWSRDGGLPAAQSLGMRLSHYKDRVSGGRRLTSHMADNTHYWRVVSHSREGD